MQDTYSNIAGCTEWPKKGLKSYQPPLPVQRARSALRLNIASTVLSPQSSECNAITYYYGVWNVAGCSFFDQDDGIHYYSIKTGQQCSFARS